MKPVCLGHFTCRNVGNFQENPMSFNLTLPSLFEPKSAIFIAVAALLWMLVAGRLEQTSAGQLNVLPNQDSMLTDDDFGFSSLVVKMFIWEPKYLLIDGLTKSIKWMKDHIDLYQARPYQFLEVIL